MRLGKQERCQPYMICIINKAYYKKRIEKGREVSEGLAQNLKKKKKM